MFAFSKKPGAAHPWMAAAALLGAVSLAQAQQVAADAAGAAGAAGAVARELQSAPPVLPKLGDGSVQAPSAAVRAESATRFTFQRLVVQGASSVSAAQVGELGAAHVGQSVGEAELSAMLMGLRRQLDDAGLQLAVIGLPRIDLAQGVVTVDVVEPRMGRVTAPMGPDAPITDERVRGLLRWFNLGEGQLLNFTALERVMFALNDMPGVQAKAKLTPSGEEGVYNLAITTGSRRSWDAGISIDNQGLSAVGRVRVGATARLNNPLGLGDNLDAQVLGSDTLGVKLGRIGYELPLGYTPARLAVAASSVQYKLGGDFDAFGASGQAKLYEASVSYPLIRARNRTLLARVSIDDKHFSDKQEALNSSSRRSLRSLAGTLAWESRDAWGGGGFWGASATLRFGDFDDGKPTQGSYEGRYRKLEVQGSRLQALTGPLSLFVAASAQQASRTLDPAEKLGLGGSRGVRAYAVSESPADDARVLNAELRWWLNPQWTVFALTDWAHGRLDHGVSSATQPSVTLRGSGLGVVAQIPNWVTLRATLAWRHSRAGAADPGHDLPRLAFQASHSF